MRPDYIPPPGAGPDGVLPAEAPVPTDPNAPPPASGPLPPANTLFDHFGKDANPYNGQAPFVPAVPDLGPAPPQPTASVAPSTAPPPAPQSSDPAAGLPGLMVPAGGGVVMRSRRLAVLVTAAVITLGMSGLRQLAGRQYAAAAGHRGQRPRCVHDPGPVARRPTTSNGTHGVRVGDVTVGKVTKIERQGWNALLTMSINADVDLPANATATLGQTSLLGSLHIALAPPKDVAPEGKLHEGSLIPLASGSTVPSTEQTLAAVSVLLNGGGIGDIQEITQVLSTAFMGRQDDLRSLIGQLDKYVTYLNDQTGDIIAAADSLNNLVG